MNAERPEQTCDHCGVRFRPRDPRRRYCAKCVTFAKRARQIELLAVLCRKSHDDGGSR